jgi:hypothetical protein
MLLDKKPKKIMLFYFINIYMPNFICKKCNKIFTKKSSYNFHILRINSCVKDDTINNDCSYCNKLFSNKYTLKSHLNICKKKKSVDDFNQSQIEELKKMFERKFEEQQQKIQEQQKKIDELSHITDNSKNITVNENSNNNNNNTTNNVINIYNAGKEDLSRLSKEDIIKICTSGTYYPLVAAEIIHCNEKYPEFQNFLISNLRSDTGKVLVNDKWIAKPQDEILSNIMHVDKKHVSTLMKDLEVEDKLKIKLESTKDEIDTNQSKEHMKKKIKNKLYNASDMITKNKKKLDKTIDN